MPSIASPEQHPADVRTMQHAATLAVLTLINGGLPPVNWRIASYTDSLSGLVLDSDDAVRRVVAEYGERLGVAPTEQRSRKDEFTTVAVDGVLDGVPVRVWGHVEQKTDAERLATGIAGDAQ